jgi:hypothetical protein
MTDTPPVEQAAPVATNGAVAVDPPPGSASSNGHRSPPLPDNGHAMDPDYLARVLDAEAADRENGLADDPERFSVYGAPTKEAEAAAGARIVTLEEFAEVDEPGAEAIVGAPGSILIPEGGDVMLYGDGGAGKTTLSIDAAFHLASGTDWLGMPVPRAVRVLLIESEGPRPLFRQKLRRKLEAWKGAGIDGRVTVFEHPWAQFTFAADEWRSSLAQIIAEHEIDVLIAGPLVRLGMDAAGTLQEVRAFMELVADLRRRCARRLAVVLVHHENKGGAVSGAWEGAGDTLLHVQAAGNGQTVVLVQKARWDSERHGKTLHLSWTEGDGFRLEGDRDYLAEIVALLADGEWRTAKEIAAPDEQGGIGAGEKTVRAILDEHTERFEGRTGEDAKALGRHPSATVWQVRSGLNAPDSPTALTGGVEEGAARCAPLKGAPAPGRTPSARAEAASDGAAHPTHTDAEDGSVADLSDDELLAVFPGSTIETTG